jgi:hypothetical protein
MRSDKDTIFTFSNFCGEHKLDFSQVKEDEVKEFVAKLTENGLSEDYELKDKQVLDQMAVNVAYAFSKGWLHPEQVMTLLELRAMKTEFINVSVMSMLNEEMQFTESTKKMLSGFLGSDQHDIFLNAIKSLPKSEQNWFIIEDKENLESTQPLIDFAVQTGIIQNNLNPIGRQAPFSEEDIDMKRDMEKRGREKRILTTLSAGARRLFTQIRYGEHAKLTFPKLGAISINDIDDGMQRKHRYQTVSYPGIDNAETFHGIQAKSYYLSLHDELHRQLISTIPNSSYEALLSAIEVVRKNTGFKWSKEIWDCIDMEAAEFLKDSNDRRNNASEQERTEDFLKLLDANVVSENRSAGLFPRSPLVETTWLLMIDMVSRPDFWKTKGVNP